MGSEVEYARGRVCARETEERESMCCESSSSSGSKQVVSRRVVESVSSNVCITKVLID